MAGRKKHRTSRALRYENEFVRIKPAKYVEIDEASAYNMMVESIKGKFLTVKPDGRCHICNKPIPSMRRLCGSCNSKRS